MTIEVLPGWELVRIGKPVVNVDWVIGSGGLPELFSWTTDSYNWPIIRKIVKPKQYRPFNDPAEAESLLGFPLRLKVDHKNKGIFIGITSHGFQIGLSHWKPKEAFDCFERLDGSPFGIEVTE